MPDGARSVRSRWLNAFEAECTNVELMNEGIDCAYCMIFGELVIERAANIGGRRQSKINKHWGALGAQDELPGLNSRCKIAC
jgi:hypothetical protein